MHENGHIMLTDFDLSKQAATSVNPQVIKKMFSQRPEIYSTPELVTNSFVGTAEYIAPEVIKGYGQSSSVDWWTFGMYWIGLYSIQRRFHRITLHHHHYRNP